MAAAVYRTILRKKKLFLQAPTGVGKTISTLFPSVKAIGEGLGEKIFYLTAKTITRTVAEQAFRILGEQGLQMKVITLTAKEKICKCEAAARQDLYARVVLPQALHRIFLPLPVLLTELISCPLP